MQEEIKREELHREQASTRLSHEGRKYFNLIEFDADEELVTEIRKHPFGMLIIVATGIFVSLVILIIAAFFSAADLNSIVGEGNPNALRGVILVAGLLMIAAVIVVTFIALFLYRSNVIFVTSEKLAQVLYISLFDRKISQLSIGDVQDVTVKQKGILAHLLNYGTLVVETAGEQQNYTFTYVPDPYTNSKMIVGTHERNLAKHGN